MSGGALALKKKSRETDYQGSGMARRWGRAGVPQRSEGRARAEGTDARGAVGSRLTGAGGCSFFFQAEDGIRDYKVTGVQTCALPICLWWHVFCVLCPPCLQNK